VWLKISLEIQLARAPKSWLASKGLSFRGTLVYKLLFKLIYLNSSVFHVFQSFRLGGVVNRFGVFVALPNELSLGTNLNLFVVLSRLTGMRL
jgi:hypothetical protein